MRYSTPIVLAVALTTGVSAAFFTTLWTLPPTVLAPEPASGSGQQKLDEVLGRLQELEEAVYALRDDSQRTAPRKATPETSSPDWQADLDAILRRLENAADSIERQGALAPSVTDLIARYPKPNVQAVSQFAASIDDDPEAEKQVYLMRFWEVIRRFGAPSAIGGEGRMQVWDYMEGDRRLMTLTFTDGRVTDVDT